MPGTLAISLDIREAAAEAAAPVPLVAMTINAELGGADASSIVRVVRDRHVDLLAVEEYTPGLEQEHAAVVATLHIRGS